MNNPIQQNKILDIIIYLLEGYKNDGIKAKTKTGEKTVLDKNSCRYLLNQTIRQYKLPNDHIVVSKAALDLWEKIRSDDIADYTYRDKIVKNTDTVVTIDKYKGSEKDPYESNVELKSGDCFTFNDVFSEEHIVTVSDIINALKELPAPDYASVLKILDKIYICKMLKSEDRRIKRKSRRHSLDFREILIEDYKAAGITLSIHRL